MVFIGCAGAESVDALWRGCFQHDYAPIAQAKVVPCVMNARAKNHPSPRANRNGYNEFEVTVQEFLLSIDTMWIVAFILGGFIVYQLRSGEIPLRFFGSITRKRAPIIYWLFILFYVAVLGIVIYAWMDGLRIPLSELFD